MLTQRIRDLTEHLREQSTTTAGGLLLLVGRRRRLPQYRARISAAIGR
jgi:ribosomal protein S15P/S13E